MMYSLQNMEEKTRYEVFRHGLFKPQTNPISSIYHFYKNQGWVSRTRRKFLKCLINQISTENIFQAHILTK